MRILVIAPHMDDEVLGCGGTIVRHVESGDEVCVCVVANRAYNHQYDPILIEREHEHCRDAQRILGYQHLTFLDLPDERLDTSQVDVIVPLESAIQDMHPDLVYLPHRGDINQDHRAVFEAARVACRPYGSCRARTLRIFEVPSSTDQAGGANEWPFRPNFHVNVAVSLERKISAMACYETESRAFPNPRSPEGLAVLAKKRGTEIGMEAAEAFMIMRDGWW